MFSYFSTQALWYAHTYFQLLIWQKTMWPTIGIILTTFFIKIWTDTRFTYKQPILLIRDRADLCPSYCQCSEEVGEIRAHHRKLSTLYAAECHVAMNSLPLVCAKNWNSLRVNLNNHSISTGHSMGTRSALFSYCHDLASLYISQTGDAPVVLTFPSLLYELVNLRRVWFHNVLLETDVLSPSNLLHITSKIELIAFSDCRLTLDPKKPLFFDTPTSLRQLRLTNISLMGEFTKHFLVNLCHTSTISDRPNDLISLYLDRNFLKGFHQDSLVGCRHLRVLQLSYNQFSGSLEQVLGMSGQISNHGWTSLRTMAHSTLFTSGILGYTPDLEVLDLTGNFISSIQSPLWAYGQRDDSSQGLPNLKSLLLSNNNLTFLARGAFQGAPNLREIDLSRNPKLFRPVHSINKALTFHSFIDPLLFGGAQHLEKLYWDFSDRTCILSEISIHSEYGTISTALVSLFAVRPLCSSGTVAVTKILSQTTKSPNNAKKQVNRWRTPQKPEQLSPSTSVMEDDVWAPIDIASSFLCVLIGFLLLILLIVLVIRSRLIYDSVQTCCRKVSSTRQHTEMDDREEELDETAIIKRGQLNKCPISFSLEHPSHGSGSTTTQEWTLVADRMTTSADFTTFISCPNHQNSTNLPPGTLLLTTDSTTQPSTRMTEPRLNNGASVVRRGSLQNRCFACLEQVTNGDDERHHCGSNICENTFGVSKLGSARTHGESPSQSGCYAELAPTFKPTEVTRVVVENGEKCMGGEDEVVIEDFFTRPLWRIART